MTDVLESDHDLDRPSNSDMLQRSTEGASEHVSSGDGESPNQAGSLSWAEMTEEEMEAKAIAELYVQREPEDSSGTRRENHISDELGVGDAEVNPLGSNAAMSSPVSGSSFLASPRTLDGEYSSPNTPQDLEDIRGFTTEDISRVAARDSTSEVLCSVSRCLTLLDDRDNQGQQTAKPKFNFIEGQKLQQRMPFERGELQQRPLTNASSHANMTPQRRLEHEEIIAKGRAGWTSLRVGHRGDDPTMLARMKQRSDVQLEKRKRKIEVFPSDIRTIEKDDINSAPVGKFLEASSTWELSKEMHLICIKAVELQARRSHSSTTYPHELAKYVTDVLDELHFCHLRDLHDLPDLLKDYAEAEYVSCYHAERYRRAIGHNHLAEFLKWWEDRGNEDENQHLWCYSSWEDVDLRYNEVVEQVEEFERELAQSESEAEEYMTSSTGGKRARL